MDELTPFCQLVKQQGVLLYRDLPWRNTQDPYAVLVSEVMLQQTQVTRVLPYWDDWLAAFPSVDSLAAASLSDVLPHWQGLGYNRRAVALKRAADICADSYSGQIPQTYDELLALPGVGPATAAGVSIFAYGEARVYLETNVRAVFLHHLFTDAEKVPDSEIIPLIEATCDRDDPRSWYYALLDYGSYLKRAFPNPSRRSKHHSRQSAFEGSARQKRALLLRAVLHSTRVSTAELHSELLAFESAAGRSVVMAIEVETLLEALKVEGFLTQDSEGFWTISGGSPLILQ